MLELKRIPNYKIILNFRINCSQRTIQIPLLGKALLYKEVGIINSTPNQLIMYRLITFSRMA